MADEDDDFLSKAGLFEGGHWYWNDVEGCLLFKSDMPTDKDEAAAVAPQTIALSAFVFRDIDVIEQMRFKKRYQRKLKPREPDIITLQDVKDLALYMAPLGIMSFSLINMLHIPTTERFLRALILYCQYYLQIAQEMTDRVKALETKIRTPTSDEIEAVYRNDLCDLRSLVAKEYSTILIELEINRLFKSEIFNNVEHRLKTGYLKDMTSLEREVLIGQCARRDTKLISRSPFINEVFCRHKQVDYRIMGIGAIKYERLSPRLRYLLMAIASPEADLSELHVTVGILGKSRSCFDTALHPVRFPTALSTTQRSQSSASTASSSFSRSKSSTSGAAGGPSAVPSRKGFGAGGKQKDTQQMYGYSDIVLPEIEIEELDILPPSFPATNAKPKLCSRDQRVKWLNRLYRLLYVMPNTGRTSDVSGRRRSSYVDY